MNLRREGVLGNPGQQKNVKIRSERIGEMALNCL